jgi:hypothetical protein
MNNQEKEFTHHFSSVVNLNATAEEAFAFLDDPMKLSSHMGKSSWMMAGSKMEIKLDARNGRGVGAEIILEGKMLGIPLFVREFVTVSEAPIKKVWETSGLQKLIVMDQYRMGFELTPAGQMIRLRVFIDYILPNSGMGRFLGNIFGKAYAKWCTDEMANGAQKFFSRKI